MANEGGAAFRSLVVKATDYSLPRNRKLFSIIHGGVQSIRVDMQAANDDLVILVDGAPRIRSKFQVIGLQLLDKKIWRWSWSVPDMDPKLTTDAIAVRKLGETNRVVELTTPELPVTTQLSTDLVFIAALVCSGDATWILARQRQVVECIVLHGLIQVTDASA